MEEILALMPESVKGDTESTLPALYQSKVREIRKILSKKNPGKLCKKIEAFYQNNMQYFNGANGQEFDHLCYVIDRMAREDASVKEIKKKIGSADDFLQKYYVYHKHF